MAYHALKRIDFLPKEICYMILELLQPTGEFNKILMKDICDTFIFLRKRTSCTECDNKICFRCVNCDYLVCDKCGINHGNRLRYENILREHFCFKM